MKDDPLMKPPHSRGSSVLSYVLQQPSRKAKSTTCRRFDTLVARYYPAVYNFASRITNDPVEAVFLTHEAFDSTRNQLHSRRGEVALVTTLLNAVIRAALVPVASAKRNQVFAV
jgi:DNA-directed RNA polymerase specialized sigma24 family protein